MTRPSSPHDARLRLDALLTELALLAKALCPEAEVEASALQYEDEDGRVEVFPPCGLSEAEEERIEQALCDARPPCLRRRDCMSPVPCLM